MSEDMSALNDVNLSELNMAESSDQGAVMVVLHPTRRTPLIAADGKPVTVTVVGIDSDVYVKSSWKGRDDSVEDLRRRAKFSSAQDDYKNAKLLAKCTLAWHGIVKGWLVPGGEINNELADFNYENAVALYSNRGVKWLYDQVNEYIADRANFLKASSKI